MSNDFSKSRAAATGFGHATDVLAECAIPLTCVASQEKKTT
ncbi:hypothetical protein D3OALGA1CA_2428 [Olavius algarvensis associated proteobacterium Delta 3]|nr:hypothetical protein D3OALGA1CA_2428 [Olavius algarvensis associated proteobacterium Delta 3]CAB5155591.1 hypothetical protein D3OALGB2SA_5084 [Olavius algarvensis associated proteobacterium Delta 3]